MFSLGRERWIIPVMSVGNFGVKQIELASFKINKKRKKKRKGFSNYRKHTWPQEEPGSTCLSVGKAGKWQPPFWYHQCQTQKQTRHSEKSSLSKLTWEKRCDWSALHFCFVLVFFWGGKTKNIKFSRVQSVRATVQWNNRKDATFMIWINRSTFYL